MKKAEASKQMQHPIGSFDLAHALGGLEVHTSP